MGSSRRASLRGVRESNHNKIVSVARCVLKIVFSLKIRIKESRISRSQPSSSPPQHSSQFNPCAHPKLVLLLASPDNSVASITPGRVIAVVQLINKQGVGINDGSIPDPTKASCEAAEGVRFTEQDEAVIGTFLGLLGPPIFQSSMFQRSICVKVSERRDMALIGHAQLAA